MAVKKTHRINLHYIQALGQEDYDHYVYSFGHDGPIRKKIEALGISVYFGPKRASIKNPFKFSIKSTEHI